MARVGDYRRAGLRNTSPLPRDLLQPARDFRLPRWAMATPYAENFHTLNVRQFIAGIEPGTQGRLTIPLHNDATLLPMGQIKRGVQSNQAQLGEVLGMRRASTTGARPSPRCRTCAARASAPTTT